MGLSSAIGGLGLCSLPPALPAKEQSRRQPGQKQNAVGRLGVLTPALRSPCARKRRLLEGLQAGVERVALTEEGPLCSRRARQARIWGPGARLPPLRCAPPSSSCGMRAGAPRSDAPSSRCPSAAAAAQSATWTPPAPESAAADRPPRKVTGALAAGPALTGSLFSVSQPSLPPDSWASLPGSPLSSPGSPPHLLGSLALSWFHVSQPLVFLKVAQP